MDWPMVAAFWGVSFLLVITPGVDWAFVISAGLGGRRSIGPAVLGVLSGHAIATLAVAAGVATLVAASPMTMTVLTFTGSAYVIWLGIQALRRPPGGDSGADTGPKAISATGGRLFAKGLVMNLLNPKLYLFFLALPQFISASASWPVGAQLVALGALHTATCAVVYVAVSYGASTILAGRPRLIRLVTLLSGVVMIGLGLALAAEETWNLVAHGAGAQ